MVFIRFIIMTITKVLKVLGVLFDYKLLFDKHLQAIIESATKTLHALGHLRQKTYGMTCIQYIQLYKSVVRPKLEIGAAAWFSQAKTRQIELLEAVQNKALKWATKVGTRASPILVATDVRYSLSTATM